MPPPCEQGGGDAPSGGGGGVFIQRQNRQAHCTLTGESGTRDYIAAMQSANFSAEVAKPKTSRG